MATEFMKYEEYDVSIHVRIFELNLYTSDGSSCLNVKS